MTATSLGAILHQALVEILGRDELDLVLGLARALPRNSAGALAIGDQPDRQIIGRPLPAAPAIMAALEHNYGQQGGRGMALRVGRACFRYGLRAYGDQTGVNQLAFRLLPLPVRIRTGLGSMARLFQSRAGDQVRIAEEGGLLYCHVAPCPLCGTRRGPEPMCYLAVGTLQEALYWLSGGRDFRVEEVDCVGRGDNVCSFLIDPTPISQ